MIAYITDPKVVVKILMHLGLPTEVPAPSPARRAPMLEDLPLEEEMGGDAPWEKVDSEGADDPRSRAPA